MDTADRQGALFHDPDAEVRKEAARALGRARTERKAASSRENGRKSLERPDIGKHIVTDEMKQKMRDAQAARREREKQERAALGLPEPETAEKKKPGRPRTRVEQTTEKRPRGRPKKTGAQITLPIEKVSENGA